MENEEKPEFDLVNKWAVDLARSKHFARIAIIYGGVLFVMGFLLGAMLV